MFAWGAYGLAILTTRPLVELSLGISSAEPAASTPTVGLIESAKNPQIQFTELVTKMRCLARIEGPKAMKTLLLVSFFLVLFGCSSLKRTKYSDTVHRVYVDNQGAKPEMYYPVQHAIFRTEKFFVVDRAQGFESLKQEQLDEWKSQADRFEGSQRYAEYGKLYGVGGVIVPTLYCHPDDDEFDCAQLLSLIDTTTGQVVATGAAKLHIENLSQLSWDECAQSLVDNFPEYFDTREKEKRLKEKEEALAAKAEGDEIEKLTLELEEIVKRQDN